MYKKEYFGPYFFGGGSPAPSSTPASPAPTPTPAAANTQATPQQNNQVTDRLKVATDQSSQVLTSPDTDVNEKVKKPSILGS